MNDTTQTLHTENTPGSSTPVENILEERRKTMSPNARKWLEAEVEAEHGLYDAMRSGLKKRQKREQQQTPKR